MKYKTSAKVVDGKLILSLPDAASPVVWQMDLIEMKASAFEIKTDDKTGQYLFVSKKQGQDSFDIIAPFDDKDKAVAALMETSKALENATAYPVHTTSSAEAAYSHAPSSSHGAYAPHPAQKKPGKGKWIGVLILFIIIGGLIFVSFNMQPRSPSSFQPSPSSSAAGGGAEQNAGVPMSADDFLRNR